MPEPLLVVLTAVPGLALALVTGWWLRGHETKRESEKAEFVLKVRAGEDLRVGWAPVITLWPAPRRLDPAGAFAAGTARTLAIGGIPDQYPRPGTVDAQLQAVYEEIGEAIDSSTPWKLTTWDPESGAFYRHRLFDRLRDRAGSGFDRPDARSDP
ncbi:hypothetical protein [Geodermatophilus amargosae]|uniref:hypothetical protein n=1 Tax=Geodermatophilus amargosae TaxID=1296565 RepID=UPI0034DFCB49